MIITKETLEKAGINWDLSEFDDNHIFDYEINDNQIGIHLGYEGFVCGDDQDQENLKKLF